LRKRLSKKSIKEVVKEVIKEVPVEVIKEVEKVVEKKVEVPVEVIKEVPVDRIVEKEVIKEIVVEKEVPVEVVKEIEKIVEKEIYVTDDETITDLMYKISDLEDKLELEVKTSNELDKEKNTLSDELEKKKGEVTKIKEDLAETLLLLNDITKDERIKELEDELDKSLNWRELHQTQKEDNEVANEEVENLKKEISKLKKQTDKKVDEKYKTFWEDEVKSHNRTKEELEELKKPKAKPKNTNNNDDIYGSDEKGWWSGGSNLMGK
jgi:chromosome segregation ATPase